MREEKKERRRETEGINRFPRRLRRDARFRKQCCPWLLTENHNGLPTWLLYPAYARSECVKLQAALETLASKSPEVREEWK